MDIPDPMETARYHVRAYVLQYSKPDTDGYPVIEAKIVSFSYTLCGWKALVIVDTNPNYYAVTYNANEDALYIDEYKKVSSKVRYDLYDGS